MSAHDVLPPHDLEAEVALLGSMLLDIKAARLGALAVSPGDFWRESHAIVFRALDKLAQDDEAIDPVLLRKELQDRGVLEKVGGIAFICKIAAAVPSAANVVHYAKIVREKARERDVLAAAGAAQRAVLDNGVGHAAIDELVQAKDALEAVRSGEPEKPRLAAPFEPFLALDDFKRPAFPLDALPRAMADWSIEAAHASQVPLELPGMLCIGVLSAALARKFEVEIRKGWREQLNTYCLTALPPGSRKTSVFAAATRVLYDYERERQNNERSQCFREKADYEALVANAERLSKARAQATRDREEVEALYEKAIDALERAPIPREPTRLLGDDVTPERLVSLLAEQDDRFAIFSAEGGLLQTAIGSRYSKTGASNFDVLLKGHAGDPIAHDRKGAPSIVCARPALTLNVCVQPEVLRNLAMTPSASGVGLLARFLYAIPDNLVGRRQIAAAAVSDMTTASYRVLVSRLLDIPVPKDPAILVFNHAAQDAMISFEESLEPRLADGGDLASIVDWASKLAGATARIAGLFAAADSEGTAEFVELDHFDRARRLTTALTEHARFALGSATDADDYQTARRLVAWIARTRSTTFSARDAYIHLKGSAGSIRRMDDLLPAIDLLRRFGYIAPLQKPRRSGPGRPTSETFAVAQNVNSAIPQN